MLRDSRSPARARAATTTIATVLYTRLAFGALLLAFSLLFIIPSPVYAFNNSGAQGSDISEQQLPAQNIKSFVNSIAMVEHYYVKKVAVDDLFKQALGGMIGRLDPHSAYLDASSLKELKIASSGKFTGIGVELIADKGVLRVVSPLDGSPAKKAGLKTGDLILKVNGQVVRGEDAKDMIHNIRGPKGSMVDLIVLHKGDAQPVEIGVKRDVITLQAVKSKELEPGFAYFRLAFFQHQAPQQLRQQIVAMEKKMQQENGSGFRGVVLDLRNNPGGLLTAGTSIANIFLTKQDKKQHNGLIVYTKGRDARSQLRVKMHPDDMLHGAPLVVLINGGTASASEILSGVLQDDKRALVIGERSFGKGSVQTVFPLGDDDAIKLTTALYFTPAGREIQARGIEPDILVPQLNIKQKDVQAFQVTEADFSSHLANKTKTVAGGAGNVVSNHRKEFTLAQNDYQLYQGLMILKGMHSHSRY